MSSVVLSATASEWERCVTFKIGLVNSDVSKEKHAVKGLAKTIPRADIDTSDILQMLKKEDENND